MSDPIFLTMTGEHHGLVSAGCSSKTSIGRYAHVNHQDQIFALSLLSGWGYEKQSERRCMSFHKFIDKSTPLLALGINENERYFLEFDFYRINQFGHFEKYYFIELRGASIVALQMNFDLHSGLDTECITVAYDYIRCRHLVAATEYYHFALPANYNSLFSVQNPIVAARNAAQRSMPKVNVSKPFGTVKTPTPTITPVFAKSCLRGAGCTDAGTSEEPAENFGQMALFAQPILGGGLLAAQDAFARMTQVWGSWSPSGVLGVARGISYVGVLASALYIPRAGEGSDRPPGQREFWHGDELRKKAHTQMKATTRVRFFWRPDSQGNMQVYGVHTGEGTPYEGVRVALMKWVEENRRYEFTPAGSVDGPLITWTPEKQAGAAGPSDTGHDVKPIDQATILVTPIPTDEDEYTTPAFPVPHERDLNDYILVFPADAGIEPIYVYLSEGNDRVSVINDVEVKLLPDANGKNHTTAVKGDATIPVDKIELYMRGKTSGDLESLQKEYNSLKDEKISSQKEFAKDPNNAKRMAVLEKQIHNIERSQDMARVLDQAGIMNTASNNSMIINKLLDSAQSATTANRQTSVVISGPNGNVRVYATWTILPDGTKRLSTVNTGAFK